MRSLFDIETDLDFAKYKLKYADDKKWYQIYKAKIEKLRKERRAWLDNNNPNWEKEYRDSMQLKYEKNKPKKPVLRMDDWTEELENYGDSPNN